jgi:hypothetical protein
MNAGLAFATVRPKTGNPSGAVQRGKRHAYCLRRRVDCRVRDVERLFLAPLSNSIRSTTTAATPFVSATYKVAGFELMRLLIPIVLASLSVLAGCCRPWLTSSDDPPPLPPQQYGEGGDYLPNSSERYQDPYASRPSGQYQTTPPTDGYQPAAPSNSYGQVPRSNQP